MSATKFLCVTTSSSKFVATSFPYPTVHRWIAVDVHLYLKFALKVTHPFRKRQFREILLNSAAAVRASKKGQLLPIGSRQCTFYWDIGEPCAFSPKSPKGWLKTFSHLALPFISSLQVIIDISGTMSRYCQKSRWNTNGVTPNGGGKWRWGRCKRRFSTNISLYLRNSAR